MRNLVTGHHFTDAEGRPAGGQTFGAGFAIAWQSGPLGRIGTTQRIEPNGAFVEDVIVAARDRLAFYQSSGFACEENADAIHHLECALGRLDCRTTRRVAALTEGTHEAA